MITAIIIDDEPNNIINLQTMVEKNCTGITVIAAAQNAAEATIAIQQFQPDLVFLDIQMPGTNGFEWLQSLPAINFEVIFVTAYNQYGIQAIKFAALDYILKPIKVTELQEAVNKAIKKHTTKKQEEHLLHLFNLLKHDQQKETHRIALASAKETRFVLTKDIIRCESDNNYTTFFLSGKEKIVVSKPIFEYETLLYPYDFIRCHQSHLVNKKFIKSLVKDNGGYILLQDNTVIPISRQKKEFVKLEMEKR
ncbi:LytR/AlgR family response regulator transcription factor [Ferruginibacter sp.]